MKEEIIATCDGSDYIHSCRYEQTFDYDDDNPSIWDDREGGCFEVTIFTSKQFPPGAKVKITIETVDEE